MTWLEKTHGAGFELVRHFLRRMLDGEWSSTPGQWQRAATGSFALLFCGGLLLLREGTIDPGQHSSQADQLALLTLVLAVTGLIGSIQWQSFFPSRRDYLSLASLPVRSRQIFLARFATVLLFSTALVIVMNILPAIVAPLEIGRSPHASLAVNIAVQAAAGGLGCFFILLSMVAMQGVLLNALPARLFARVSVYVQGGVIGMLLLAGLYSWSIRDWQPQTLARLPQFGAWAPPVWFLGLRERWLGESDPFLNAMAARALWSLVISAALVSITYLLTYRRYRRLLLEAPVRIEAPRRHGWSLLRLVARDPRQQAAMEFMARTLLRSRTHRVLWLAYVGGALGLVINSSLVAGVAAGKEARFLVLFWPPILSVVLLNGFRHVLSIPAELNANWIFRMTESEGRKQWMRAVERFVLLYAVAPIYALTIPLAIYTVGLPVAMRMTALQVLFSLIVFELLFYSWQQLPFTCSYVPGKRAPVAVVAGYIAVLGAGVPVVSLMIRAGSTFAGVFPFYAAIFAGTWYWWFRQRRDGWGDSPLLYEDLPGAMPNLGIREMSYGHS